MTIQMKDITDFASKLAIKIKPVLNCPKVEFGVSQLGMMVLGLLLLLRSSCTRLR